MRIQCRIFTRTTLISDKKRRNLTIHFLFIGKRKQGHTSIETDETVLTLEEIHKLYPKNQKGKLYQRSARAESRIATKKNAAAILACWTFCPFRWTKNRFKCAYCEADFTECTSLRDHVRICSTQHTINDVYNKFREMPLINVDATDAICCICSAPFQDISQMHDHVIQHGFEFNLHHRDGVLPFFLDKESWKCFICSEKFNNFLKLYEHMNVHYQYYICDVCGKGYMTAPRLRKHSEVHISGSFACTECGKVFFMRAARDAHKASAHSKGPRYECPHCNTRFHSYYDRMTHLKETHSEKEVVYKCSYCDLSFKTSGSRATHVRNVHFLPQLDFKCSSCHWKFKTSYELKRHMVRHTLKAKTYRCTFCSKSFLRVKALTTHVKTHQDLNCKWCGLAFKQRSQLVLHLQATHGDLMDLTPMDIKETCCE